jgi:hypothetical protein
MNAAGTNESTSQRSCFFRIETLKNTGPTRAPFSGWTRSTRSMAPARTESTVQPWKLAPAAGNGMTGRLPRAQPARVPPRCSADVASAQARSGCVRRKVAATKTSSVRLIAARSV